jgi:hypothetical protein
MPFTFRFRLIFLIPLIALQACVGPFAALGTTGTAAASSVGTSATAAAVANPATAASIATTATTGKSPLEHVASAATKKECSFFNVFSGKSVCQDVVMPKVTDYSTPLTKPENPSTAGSQ